MTLTPGMVANLRLALVLAMPDQEPTIERLDLSDARMELLGQERHCILRRVRQHCAVCLPDPLNEIAAAASSSAGI